MVKILPQHLNIFGCYIIYKYSQIQEILQTVQQEFYYYYKQSLDTGNHPLN